MKIHVVFDGPPSHETGRFIETELPDGRGVGCGEWLDRGDGTWAMVIDVVDDTVRLPTDG